MHWDSYIVSIAKTASRKVRVLVRSMEFLSPEIALYLHKSTIPACIRARSCYIYMLDKLQKVICRTCGPSLGASFEPLGHRRNVASLSTGITSVDIHMN